MILTLQLIMNEQKHIAHPNLYSIIESDGFAYLYIGSMHSHATLNRIKEGDMIDSGGGSVTSYDPSDPNYMYVRACHGYKGKYWLIPSTFSMIGTLDPKTDWKIISPKLGYEIKELDYATCAAICPGYLD